MDDALRQKEINTATIKILDKLLIKSFLPPFFVALGIAMFVLTMQVLWLYVDEIMGKGVSFWILLEFIFYLSISLVPMSMSIAMLLASVMTMGNLAERYELASMKSSGISLARIMKPLAILAIGMGVLSFIFSNYLIPVANLKFKSRLYDIRTQKPALSLEESVFNYDFQGFVIRIGKKHKDKIHLENILIINQGNRSDESAEIIANTGEMYTTDDKKYFVMKLHDGWQYQELNKYQHPKKKYPFVRTKFAEWQKIFDLTEFEMETTDPNLFKSHQSMLNVKQLMIAIDSLKSKKIERLANLSKVNELYFTFSPSDKKTTKTADSTKVKKLPPKTSGSQKLLEKRRIAQKIKQKKRLQQLPFQIDTVHHLIETFPERSQYDLLTKAKSAIGRVQSSAYRAASMREGIDKKLRLFWFEMLSKFNIAIACVVFLFIGAPMGAIIRKGGFGYPLLVAIAFFIIFIMISMVGKKMNSEQQMNVWLASFLSSMVLLPIGFYLTRQAMKDAQVFNIRDVQNFFSKLFNRE